MPEEQTIDNQTLANDPCTEPAASSQLSIDSRTVELPVADGDDISLRITIEFERRPRSSHVGPAALPTAVGGGSQECKEAGGRSHPPRNSTEG